MALGFGAARNLERFLLLGVNNDLYEVTLPDGQKLKALRSNLTRWDQEDFALGENVWLAWHACSPAVLLS